MSEHNRREQGRDTIWDCICGEQLEIRHFSIDADATTAITHTSCGNCGESWWITGRGQLHHGTTDEAIAAFRSTRGGA